MKKRVVIAVIAIIVAITVVLGSIFEWDEIVKNKVSRLWGTEQGETEVVVANATSETATTPEPTAEVSAAAEYFCDGNGKNYYASPEVAISRVNTLQGRIDDAVIPRYNVYDVLVPQNDIVVKDALGNEIDARYQLDLSDINRVELLRDGSALLLYSYDADAFREDTNEHQFTPAQDEGFSEKVFCQVHRAVRSTTAIRVGYTGAIVGKWGIRGSFQFNMLDNEMFSSVILVKRNVIMEDGSVHEMCTWVIRECGCGMDDTIPAGDNPAQPTDAPTVKPTDAPTVKPTEDTEPQPTPTPTAKPTKPAEDTEPQPTPTPTAKPTKPAEDTEPQPTPTAPSKPTEEPGEGTGDHPTKPPVTPVETLGSDDDDFLSTPPSQSAEKSDEGTSDHPSKLTEKSDEGADDYQSESTEMSDETTGSHPTPPPVVTPEEPLDIGEVDLL